MPAYTYLCESCGLRFEQRVGMSQRGQPQPCQSCEKPANQVLTADVGFTVNQATTGMLPQNTGFSQIDHSFDRTIAQDSAKKWKEIDQRETRKRALLRDMDPSKTTRDLARTPDGDYKLIKPEERKIAEVGRAIDSYAMAKLRADREISPSK